MSIKPFLHHAVVTACACAMALSVCSAAPAAKPNILWVVAEDINPHLGCYGDTNADTPNLDRFAAQGLRYKTCWSVAPVCAPARTALISGMYPSSLGAEHMRSLVKAPASLRSYPELLRQQGYYCVNNSKTDYNLEFTSKIWNESSPRAHYKNRQPGQPFFAAFNIELTHESKIRQRPHTLIHDPARVRVPAYHPARPEVRHDWAQYYDNIAAMDRVFGQRLKELEAAGLAEDTIVFFYGDNGGGMPRGKRWPYNSGLRVPLIVRVPEKFKHLAPGDYAPGAETPRLVSFVDFAPTLLKLIGAASPAWIEGQPFMGSGSGAPRKYLYGLRGRMDERYDLVRSISNGRYIYIQNFMPHVIYGQHSAYMFQTPTTRVWKELYDQGRLVPPQTFFWEKKPPEELYDLTADPDEVVNLAAVPAQEALVRELRGALREHLIKTRDLGFIPEGEMHRLAGEQSPYDWAREPGHYNVKDVLQTAELAAGMSAEATPRLSERLKSADGTVRYWAVLGFLMRGSNAVLGARSLLQTALQDTSPPVAITAARALGELGDADLDAVLGVLTRYGDPARNGEYTALMALDAIDSLGERGRKAREQFKGLKQADKETVGRGKGYVSRLVSEW